MENNKAYDAACEKAQVAHEVFALVRQSYRAGLTDDATFLAAKAVYEKAQAEYDVAFAAASDVATTDTTTLCGCGAAVRVEDGGEQNGNKVVILICSDCDKDIDNCDCEAEDSDARDESDYIDIIESAKAAWFESHPECDVPTSDNTDEEINKALGLNPSGSLRGLELDLVEMSNAEIAECVADGLDNWLVSVTNKCEECSETFLEGHGFCGDDMVLCAACALKYAETHPDEIEATGRSF